MSAENTRAVDLVVENCISQGKFGGAWEAAKQGASVQTLNELINVSIDRGLVLLTVAVLKLRGGKLTTAEANRLISACLANPLPLPLWIVQAVKLGG